MADGQRPIDEFADALRQACVAHPDERIGQVIVNALGSDPFHVDDARAVAELRRYAESGPPVAGTGHTDAEMRGTAR